LPIFIDRGAPLHAEACYEDREAPVVRSGALLPHFQFLEICAIIDQ